MSRNKKFNSKHLALLTTAAALGNMFPCAVLAADNTEVQPENVKTSLRKSI